ncbi:hypothetical protein F66182_6959 [Fusarium sp. NRRL 66182]|nr:hypothetical protein F66182_6959 [Fusarium sp. NRRL 66182]
MPPIRTLKQTTLWGVGAPLDNRPRRTPLKSLPEGLKDAHFQSSRRDWDGKYEEVIGTSTRSIIFGSEFVLTDNHINDILALGNPICAKIVQFIFQYQDVSYTAHNSAMSLTNEAVVRLGQSCPNLKKVQLQATSRVTDVGLLGFLENCPKLVSVELTGTVGSTWTGLSGEALDQLREHPEWVPKLKNLILGENDRNTPFMKAMRSLTKDRLGLTVTLLERSQVKKWGDWELEKMTKTYKKGRLQAR